MKKKSEARLRKRRAADVVRLEDLAPRKPVKGGGRHLLFGERLEPAEDEAPDRPKDRSKPPD